MTEILLTTNFSFKACTEPNSFELCRAVEKSTKLMTRIKRIVIFEHESLESHECFLCIP